LFYLESTAVGIGYFGVAATISLILGGIFLLGFFRKSRHPWRCTIDQSLVVDISGGSYWSIAVVVCQGAS
jgi:hypothetical protein